MLTQFFGADTLVQDISIADACRFYAALQDGEFEGVKHPFNDKAAGDRITSYIVQVRSIFNVAVTGELIVRSPFKVIRVGKDSGLPVIRPTMP